MAFAAPMWSEESAVSVTVELASCFDPEHSLLCHVLVVG